MNIVDVKELVLDVTERVKALRALRHHDERAAFDHNPLILCTADQPIARIYMFHGFRDTADYWQNEPAKSFVDYWVSAGAQVVLPTLPYAKIGMFRNGGAAYRGAYLAMLEHLERTLQPVQKRFVAGISWGGYHSMLAAASQDIWDGYVALLPVAKPGVLREFWYLGRRQGPRIDAAALRSTPGFVSYGTRDRRANWREAARLASAAGVDAVVFEGRDHSAFGDELDLASNWMREKI